MQSKCTHHDFSRHISTLLRDHPQLPVCHIIDGKKFGVHIITKTGAVCCDTGEKETHYYMHIQTENIRPEMA
jgi:hypothetical protein